MKTKGWTRKDNIPKKGAKCFRGKEKRH